MESVGRTGLQLPRVARTLVTVLVGSASSAAAREDPPACDRPPIQLNRFEEDYAFLANPACATEPWDPLKYILLARDPETVLSLGVGSELALRLQWQADRHATLVASYSHFFAGPFLRDAGLASDVDFFACWISYRL